MRIFLNFWLIAAICCLLGCAPKAAMQPQQLAAEPPRRDVFAAGDVVEVKFTFTPQFNLTQTISPEGQISLPLVGEVKAQGKTRSELRQELMKLYTPQLEKPEIQVIARKQIKRRIYVAGQVNKPGPVEMPGDMTVLEAITEAGWVDVRTAASYILIIRQQKGESYGAVLQMKDTLEGKRTASFELQPQDIVYVPRSGINKANQWIDQHINKMVPQTGFTLFYPIGPGNLGRLGLDTSQTRVEPR
jgi:protein involved in polysaccharide export with SLBB domain